MKSLIKLSITGKITVHNFPTFKMENYTTPTLFYHSFILNLFLTQLVCLYFSKVHVCLFIYLFSKRDPSASFTFTTIPNSLWDECVTSLLPRQCRSRDQKLPACVFPGQVWTKQTVKPNTKSVSCQLIIFQRSRCCRRLNVALKTSAQGTAFL